VTTDQQGMQASLDKIHTTYDLPLICLPETQ
jgi:hypothetical protein